MLKIMFMFITDMKTELLSEAALLLRNIGGKILFRSS